MTEKRRKKQTASLRIVRYIGGRADRKGELPVVQKGAQRRSRKEQYRAAGRREAQRGKRMEPRRPAVQKEAL